MSEYPFTGCDWLELLDYFNIPRIDDGDEEDLHSLQVYLNTQIKLKQNNKRIKACRAFIKAIHKESEKHNYDSPLWKGLSEIEDDETFMRFLIILVGDAWT